MTRDANTYVRPMTRVPYAQILGSLSPLCLDTCVMTAFQRPVFSSRVTGGVYCISSFYLLCQRHILCKCSHISLETGEIYLFFFFGEGPRHERVLCRWLTISVAMPFRARRVPAPVVTELLLRTLCPPIQLIPSTELRESSDSLKRQIVFSHLNLSAWIFSGRIDVA